MRKTKIVATIGPASESKATVYKMIQAGMNVARLNFSHGTYPHHAKLMQSIAAAAKKAGTRVAIMQDLQGPRIRIGDLPEKELELTAGDEVILVAEKTDLPKIKKEIYIPIQYETLYKDVKPGHPILIDDAKIVLKVLLVKEKKIFCRVQIGDVLRSRRGMNFPKTSISAPALTEKDIRDLVFGIKSNVDYVALSFVKNGLDIQQLRQRIIKLESKFRNRKGKVSSTKIIAKIERPEAVKNFDEILKAADGIMVARGDLGLELPVAELPGIQKKIIRRCIIAGKPVIVATQMLDSMIKYPTPTRAEISDVANAVLDGADAIMLSGETATGKYPVETIVVMNKIAKQAETDEVKQHEQIEDDLKVVGTSPQAMAYACQDVAEDVAAKAIVCTSVDGTLPLHIAKYRSAVPVIALVRSQSLARQLSLVWGATSEVIVQGTDFATLSAYVKDFLKKQKVFKKKTNIIFISNFEQGFSDKADTIQIVTL